jgi:hypothetical protein
MKARQDDLRADRPDKTAGVSNALTDWLQAQLLCPTQTLRSPKPAASQILVLRESRLHHIVG